MIFISLSGVVLLTLVTEDICCRLSSPSGSFPLDGTTHVIKSYTKIRSEFIQEKCLKNFK